MSHANKGTSFSLAIDSEGAKLLKKTVQAKLEDFVGSDKEDILAVRIRGRNFELSVSLMAFLAFSSCFRSMSLSWLAMGSITSKLWRI